MKLKIFLPLITIFALSVAGNSFAQQSCNSLFESAKKEKLRLGSIKATSDLIKFFSRKNVIDQIKARNPFTEHSPELEVSIQGAIKNLKDKLTDVQKLKVFDEHKGFEFLSTHIRDQLLVIRNLIKNEKLSYINYYYNSFVLTASLDALLRFESSVLSPNLKLFEKITYTREEEVILNATNSIDALPLTYQLRFIARDMSLQNLDTIIVELGKFKSYMGEPADPLRIFMDTHYLPIFTFKTIQNEDFIGIDMESLLLIETSNKVNNPHDGSWFPLYHANHDIFHIKSIIAVNKELISTGLAPHWIEVREKIKGYINQQDLSLRSSLNEHLYDVIHNNSVIRLDIAQFYKGYREGGVDKDLFEKIYDMNPGVARLLMGTLNLNPDGSPISKTP